MRTWHFVKPEGERRPLHPLLGLSWLVRVVDSLAVRRLLRVCRHHPGLDRVRVRTDYVR